MTSKHARGALFADDSCFCQSSNASLFVRRKSNKLHFFRNKVVCALNTRQPLISPLFISKIKMSTNRPPSDRKHDYTLVYFDGKGRAEPVRYILAYLQIPYTDKRLTQAEWKSVKNQMPCLQIPVLELRDADKPGDEGKPDGNVTKIGQSVAICRFLGRQHGLCGKDDVENAYLDMIADFMKDINFELSQPTIIRDEVNKAEVFHRVLSESLPGKVRALAKLMKLGPAATSNKFILGDNPCWVDFFVAGMCEYFNSFIAKDKLNKISPPLVEHLKSVQSLPNVKEWVAKRPNTSF